MMSSSNGHSRRDLKAMGKSLRALGRSMRFSNSSLNGNDPEATGELEIVSKDQLIWYLDHDTQIHRLGVVVEDFLVGNDVRVAPLENQSGEIKVLSPAEQRSIRPVRDNFQVPVSDLVTLNDLHEGSILHTLSTRYSHDEVYTAIDQILVAINPYKPLSIYDEIIQQAYVDQCISILGNVKDATKVSESSPHIFRTANQAFMGLVNSNQNQVCIVSGESGAGKTETSKYFLSYLTELSETYVQHSQTQKKDDKSTNNHKLIDLVRASNPLIEAFGNAATLRNRNSSRFGKLLQVNFDINNFQMCGCGLETFLLEKSRVTQHEMGERNYHIFYQLLYSIQNDPPLEIQRVADQENSKYKFIVSEFDYLSPENSNTIGPTTIDDGAAWNATYEALRVLLPVEDQREELYSLLLGVLVLGNVTFVPETNSSADDTAKIEDTNVLEIAACYLGLDVNVLQETLLCSVSQTSSGEVIRKHYNVTKAMGSRDCLARTIYNSLFHHLIESVKKAFVDGFTESKSVNETRRIGVLDLYGFENFNTNGFEQLCINYSNEKLQVYFIDRVVVQELAAYETEGVMIEELQADMTELIQSRISTLKLLESRDGVFGTCDDAVRLSGLSEQLGKKLEQLCLKHEQDMDPTRKYVLKKKSNEQQTFSIHHYAGRVTYNVSEFVVKNQNKESNQVYELLAESSYEILKLEGTMGLAASFESRETGNKKRVQKPQSLLAELRHGLQKLTTLLDVSQSHYVRCVKPNTIMESNNFDWRVTGQQLRSTGVMDVINVRKHGFGARIPFDEFVSRFGILSPNPLLWHANSTTENNDTLIDAVRTICEDQDMLNTSEWRLGKTRVFLRSKALEELEVVRSLRSFLIDYIQSFVRGWRVRKDFKNQVRAVTKLQQFVRKFQTKQAFAKLVSISKHLRELIERPKATANEVQVLTTVFQKEVAQFKTLMGVNECDVGTLLLDKSQHRADSIRAKNELEARWRTKGTEKLHQAISHAATVANSDTEVQALQSYLNDWNAKEHTTKGDLDQLENNVAQVVGGLNEEAASSLVAQQQQEEKVIHEDLRTASDSQTDLVEDRELEMPQPIDFGQIENTTSMATTPLSSPTLGNGFSLSSTDPHARTENQVQPTTPPLAEQPSEPTDEQLRNKAREDAEYTLQVVQSKIREMEHILQSREQKNSRKKRWFW